VLDPSIFISHRYPLDRYADALEQFRAGVGRKIQVVP
jgi:threonine dehydrogenase-like Zn-dependent dehydrogenase